MKRGSKPTPSVVKRLRGTARPDNTPREPATPGGMLVADEQLDRLPHARDFWDHFIRTAPRGVLKPVDAPLLERLCCALALARTAMDQVIKAGMVINVAGVGNPPVFQVNPFLSAVNRQTEMARKLASELGLPVTARARIDAPGDGAVITLEADAPAGGHPRNALERFLDLHPDRPIN